MQYCILEQAKVAECRADFMERATLGKSKKAACLVEKARKMINFIWKKIDGIKLLSYKHLFLY